MLLHSRDSTFLKSEKNDMSNFFILFYLPFWLDGTTDSGLLAAGEKLNFDVFSVTVSTSSLFEEEFAGLSFDREVGAPTFVALMLEIRRIAESFFPFLLGECLSAESRRCLKSAVNL